MSILAEPAEHFSAPIGAVVWYDRSVTDHRPWLVRRGDRTVRAAQVAFASPAVTDFAPEGFPHLLPSGPRGIIRASSVATYDEVEVQT